MRAIDYAYKNNMIEVIVELLNLRTKINNSERKNNVEAIIKLLDSKEKWSKEEINMILKKL